VSEMPPTNPAILDLTLDMLDNILIINPPQERMTNDEFYALIEKKNINPLDIDFLDEQLLEEDELDRDYLEFTELDIDYLNVDFLQNLLDDYSDLDIELLEEEEDKDTLVKGTLEGFDGDTQFNTIVDGEKVTLVRNVQNIVEISVSNNEETTINLDTEGREFDPITVNGGGSSTINIKQ
jgi:hypothetical protein